MDHKIELELAGHAPVERIASSAFDRLEFESRDIRLDFELAPIGEVPEGMVLVPGGDYSLVAWGRATTATVNLGDYFIDKYEVSNRQYRDFVTGGGYFDEKYWQHPMVLEGRSLAWKDAMGRLVDTTGLPGPRGWSNQEFPPGSGDHPVTGITWHEAAAYAAFSGKRLPTVFEWEKAAQDGIVTHLADRVMPWGLARLKAYYLQRANFSSASAQEVQGNEFGISPYGCYNMAGNAKEWCRNRTTKGYSADGGSFEDPAYLYGNTAFYDEFFASASLGFRCARSRHEDGGDQGGFPIRLEERSPVYEAVDSSRFQTYLEYFRYDRPPLGAQVTETLETPEWIRERVTFAGAGEDKVIAYLYLPRNAAAPYQCLNFAPYGGAFYGMAMSDIVELELTPHLKSGRAVLAVVPRAATERSETPVWLPVDSVKFREKAVQQVVEWSMALDYLATRGDIDMEKLAYLGMSWGASSTGLVSLGVEQRYRGVVLVAAAIELFDPKKLGEVNPINFVSRIRAPKLIIQGRYDERFPLETHARPLYALLQEPKQLIVVEAGHLPPFDQRAAQINRFLDETLGQVPRR